MTATPRLYNSKALQKGTECRKEAVEKDGGNLRLAHWDRSSFPCLLGKRQGKPTKRARISHACRAPQILGKQGKNAQNRKEFLEKEKCKEIKKTSQLPILYIRQALGCLVTETGDYHRLSAV